MINDVLEITKKRLTQGMFFYTKKNGQTIAPCGLPRRCKGHHYNCPESDTCERVCTIPEKADQRIFAEAHLRGWKKRPPRLRQRLKAWEQEYRGLGNICKTCSAIWCEKYDVNGEQTNPDCKQKAGNRS